MAPSYGDQFSADRLNNIKLLERYKCKLCSKWKPHGCFSNRELKNYRLKAATGVQVNGASALLRCVGCTEEPRHELECQGPCGKTLALAAFSKSSRKAGGNKWCQDCTNWKESAEPDVVVGPAPQAVLAPDEAWNGNSGNAGNAGNTGYREMASEVGGGNLVEEPQQSNPYNWYARSAIADGFSGSIAPVSVTYGPPDQSEASTTVTGKESANSIANDDIATVSSASNLYEDLATIDLGGDWEASDVRRREPVTFNAYDSNGQLHRRQQTPPGSETARSTSTIKPHGNEISSQSTSTVKAHINNTSDNPRKFARPAGTKRPPPQVTHAFSSLTTTTTVPSSRAVYSIEDDSDGGDY